jgi:hypothetical protein
MISGDWAIVLEDANDPEKENKMTYLGFLQERKELNDYLGRANTDVQLQKSKLIKLAMMAPPGQVQFLLEMAPISMGHRGSNENKGTGWKRITGFEHGLSVRDNNILTVERSVSPLDSINRLLDIVIKLHQTGEKTYYALKAKYKQSNFISFLPWFLSPKAKTDLEENWPLSVKSSQPNSDQPSTDPDLFHPKTLEIAQSSKEAAWKPEEQMKIGKATEIFLKQLFGTKVGLGDGGCFGFAHRFPEGWPSFFDYVHKISSEMKGEEESKIRERICNELSAVPKLLLISEHQAQDLIASGKSDCVVVKRGESTLFFQKGKPLGKSASKLVDLCYSVKFGSV